MHSNYLCEANITMFEIGVTIANLITFTLEMPSVFALATYTGVSNVDNLCISGGLHSRKMETGDHSASLAWMAGIFEKVGACGVADVSAMASVRRSDDHFCWRKLNSRPLW